jgi:hypothetical protein
VTEVLLAQRHAGAKTGAEKPMSSSRRLLPRPIPLLRRVVLITTPEDVPRLGSEEEAGHHVNGLANKPEPHSGREAAFHVPWPTLDRARWRSLAK